MEIKPKNFLVDGAELYFLKMAVEGSSIPLICKLAAYYYTFMPTGTSYEWYDTDYTRQIRQDRLDAWSDISSGLTGKAINYITDDQKRTESINEMVKAEFKSPASRIRVAFWLVAIAAVVIVPFVLLAPK